MSVKPVGLGVIGYGHFIRTNFVLHLRHCSAIRIAGVYNRGEDRRRQAREDGYRVFPEIKDMLACPEVEAVLVGTANAAHKEQAILAARAGKHILCEKPMALSIAEANEMVDAAARAGVITHVNHPGPYGEEFVLFRDLCRQHAGRVLHFWQHHSRAFGLWIQGAQHGAVAHPEDSGGWIFHHTCHALNAACLMVGSSRATRVYTLAQKSCPEAPSEEMVNALITFDNGATASLSDGTPIGQRDDMGVQGTTGDLRMVNGVITVDQPGPVDPTGRPGQKTHVVQKFPVPPGGKNLEATGYRFAEAVRGGKNELLSFAFIRDQYRILEAMRESARTGNAVTPAS